MVEENGAEASGEHKACRRLRSIREARGLGHCAARTKIQDLTPTRPNVDNVPMANTINSNRSILVFMRCYQTSLVTIGVYPVGSCLIAPARPTVATSPAGR